MHAQLTESRFQEKRSAQYMISLQFASLNYAFMYNVQITAQDVIENVKPRLQQRNITYEFYRILRLQKRSAKRFPT